MLSDSEPLQVLFACGRLSALPTSPDWACIPGVAGLCPLPFQVPHAAKSWAAAFSFYPCKSSVNLSVPLLFCAVSSNEKAFPLLPCQREWLGKRGYEEHIPVQCYYTVVDILGEQLQCTQLSTTLVQSPSVCHHHASSPGCPMLCSIAADEAQLAAYSVSVFNV